jgi:hypothetical protein
MVASAARQDLHADQKRNWKKQASGVLSDAE